MAVRIPPIPDSFLRRVREEGIDDLGQQVRHLVADGGEPCRDVLRRARSGEHLILASFTPFEKRGPFREYGPIFVLADESDESVRLEALPHAGGPMDYLQERFVVRAYSAAEEILDAEMVEAADLAATVERFLASDGVAFLHVRFPTYGCFAMRIDRS